ncbi:hypothetical protein Anas_01332, partial [Armadillidium nasatum]
GHIPGKNFECGKSSVVIYYDDKLKNFKKNCRYIPHSEALKEFEKARTVSSRSIVPEPILLSRIDHVVLLSPSFLEHLLDKPDLINNSTFA